MTDLMEQLAFVCELLQVALDLVDLLLAHKHNPEVRVSQCTTIRHDH
jgi:hypothetical protein